jgi:predicted nucleotidyltransferase
MEKIREKYPYLFKNDSEIEKEKKYKLALKAANRISTILKEEFDATEVRLFGSLVDKERFSENSDIDIAERGILPERFYSSYAAITRAIGDFKIDLVDMEDCKEGIKKAIEAGEII